MRALLTSMPILLFAGVVVALNAGQPEPREIQADLSYFENVWGFKKKSLAIELYPAEGRKMLGPRLLLSGRCSYSLEFGRDIQNYDLQNLQQLLVVPEGKIRHVFFDADNIAINSVVPSGYRLQGEVSGVKGDVIRITIEFAQDAEIQKIDPRGIDQAVKFVARRN